MARNWRRKCDDVDYDCDSGGEDYEYESEGEDIMDEGDDLEDEDEDLEVEDEEEDGQEFFIPDTRIILHDLLLNVLLIYHHKPQYACHD